MEPKLPTPDMNPERSSGFYSQPIERQPSFSPERNGEREIQKVERQEVAPQERTQQPILPPPVVPAVPVDDAAASNVSTMTVVDAPLVANDDDLIEKEWVDKAKQIIANTRDDPYRRELEVGQLQADYLKKRYGKDLGAPR
ncbi:hypothetical protein PV379_02780 [Streptomyces caniscabiei]|uniref:hypothetical protein n=1 Tax=Streptomyces caniscabiei TaxID=2746961 RepID=UPI0029A9AEDC|nr:hypothetical protein [Streptomyces caniscabiei]MDX2776275.1 hypothetical protein [Streptomyces caniscabiei]